jgi:uncharacterized glyoxalase superfamily protein PhnB
MRAILTGRGKRFSARGFAPRGCRWPVSHWPLTGHTDASRCTPVHSGHEEVVTMAGTGKGGGSSRPGVVPTLLYADAKAAIRQLTEGLGFTEVTVYEGEDGTVEHAELAQGNGMVMLGSKGRGGVFDAAMKGAGPAGVYVVVDDVDAHHRRAVEQGVEVLMPPTDQDYGSRDYMARDLEGNVWSFGTYAPEAGA